MNYSGQNQNFSNANVNGPGSQYAADYGRQSNTLTYDIVRKIIYDSTPEEYPDLKILMMNEMESVEGDEFIYYEAQTFRKGVITPVLTANIAAAVQQVIPVVNTGAASEDTLIVHPSTEQVANIVKVDTSLGQMTIRAMSGETLPALASGTSYVFGNMSTITADGQSNIVQSQRLDELIKRTNNVQLFNRSTTFGVVEMGKYLDKGTTDYIDLNRRRLMDEFKYDMANAYWMGRKGEVILANGTPAKTMGGIAPSMYAAGSYQATVTPANLLEGIRQACLNTLFKKRGYVKFLYIHPTWIDELQKQYKQPLIRYVPETGTGDNSDTIDLELQSIKFGHTTVVLVPMQRFEPNSGSFPASWYKKGFLLDQASIKPRFCKYFPESMGQLASRMTNTATLNTYDTEYVQGSLSQQHDNPLGGAIINVNV